MAPSGGKCDGSSRGVSEEEMMETYKTNLYLLDGKHMGKFYVAAESFEDAIKIGHHYLEKAYKNGWPELRVVSKYEEYVVGEEKK